MNTFRRHRHTKRLHFSLLVTMWDMNRTKVFSFITHLAEYNCCQLLLTSEWCNFSIGKMIVMTFWDVQQWNEAKSDYQVYRLFLLLMKLTVHLYKLIKFALKIHDGNHHINRQWENTIIKNVCHLQIYKFALSNKKYIVISNNPHRARSWNKQSVTRRFIFIYLFTICNGYCFPLVPVESCEFIAINNRCTLHFNCTQTHSRYTITNHNGHTTNFSQPTFANF